MSLKDSINDTDFIKRVFKVIASVLIIAAVMYFIWRFSFLIVYVLTAAVVSFIGHPIVRFFDGLHIKKYRIPHSVNSFIALIVLILFVAGLIALFVPLIHEQATTISQIDFDKLSNDLKGPLAWLQSQLVEFEFINPGESLEVAIAHQAKSLVNIANADDLVSGVFGAVGSMAVHLFAVIFISYFFLKDEHMFEDIVLAIVEEKHIEATKRVFNDSKFLLRRYFLGVSVEVLLGMGLITVALWLLGVENALLIGFFAGLVNIIPYLGALLGIAVGLVLGIAGIIATGDYSSLLPLTIKIAAVMVTVHELDAIFYQPLIYAKRIQAHPLEVFFAIMIGGSLGGILGMLVAVPVYTLFRVIAREFFSNFRVIRELTAPREQ